MENDNENATNLTNLTMHLTIEVCSLQCGKVIEVQLTASRCQSEPVVALIHLKSHYDTAGFNSLLGSTSLAASLQENHFVKGDLGHCVDGVAVKTVSAPLQRAIFSTEDVIAFELYSHSE